MYKRQVENGILTQITETTDISRDSGFADDTIVSMNMWGLDTGIFDYLEKEFHTFLDNHGSEPKTEFFLPSVINKRMTEEKMPVRVEETDEKWYGITYREDTPSVREALKIMTEKGMYKWN